MTAVFALFGADPPLPETLVNAARFIDRLVVRAAVKPVLCRAIAWEIDDGAFRFGLAGARSLPRPVHG